MNKTHRWAWLQFFAVFVQETQIRPRHLLKNHPNQALSIYDPKQTSKIKFSFE